MSDSQVDESDDFGSRDEEEDELSDEESEEAIPPARKVRKAAQVARLSWTGKQPKTAQMISRRSGKRSLTLDVPSNCRPSRSRTCLT